MKYLVTLLLGFTLLVPPVYAQSLSPSPSPSQTSTQSRVCADKGTGIPRKSLAANCPTGSWDLGTLPVLHGTVRPTKINPTLLNRYRAAKQSAASQGLVITLTSGWRSWAQQSRIFQVAVRKYGSVALASHWALPPERSNHVWGVAIDLHFGSARAKTWFTWHSAQFGLCRLYKNEWWHYEPVIAPGGVCPAMTPYAH